MNNSPKQVMGSESWSKGIELSTVFPRTPHFAATSYGHDMECAPFHRRSGIGCVGHCEGDCVPARLPFGLMGPANPGATMDGE